MAIPFPTMLNMAQGFDVGLQSRRQQMADAIARRQLEIEQGRLAASKEQAAGQLGLGYAELGEKRLGRVGDEGFRQQQLGLSGRELSERERANLATEGLGAGRLGLDTQRFGAENSLATRGQAETERAAQEREALGRGTLSETSRSNVAGEQARTEELAIRQRAELSAEHEIEVKERQQNRQLDQAEKAQITDAAIRREQMAQQGSQFGAEMGFKHEQLGQQESQFGRNLGLQQAELAQKGQQFTGSQAQQESQFGRTLGLQHEELAQKGGQFDRNLGLQTRQQSEVERQARVADQQGATKLGLAGREQTERETQGAFGRQVSTRELSQKDAEIQFRTFESNLKNAVDQRQLDIQVAKNMQDKAMELSRQGLDIEKHFTTLREGARQFDAGAGLRGAHAANLMSNAVDNMAQAGTRQMQAEAQANMYNAQAGTQAPWKEKQRMDRESEAAAFSRSSNAPLTPGRFGQDESMKRYETTLEAWKKRQGDNETQKKLAALFKEAHLVGEELKPRAQRDLWGNVKGYAAGSEALIKRQNDLNAAIQALGGSSPSVNTLSSGGSVTTTGPASASDLGAFFKGLSSQELQETAQIHPNSAIRSEAQRRLRLQSAPASGTTSSGAHGGLYNLLFGR